MVRGLRSSGVVLGRVSPEKTGQGMNKRAALKSSKGIPVTPAASTLSVCCPQAELEVRGDDTADCIFSLRRPWLQKRMNSPRQWMGEK